MAIAYAEHAVNGIMPNLLNSGGSWSQIQYDYECPHKEEDDDDKKNNNINIEKDRG